MACSHFSPRLEYNPWIWQTSSGTSGLFGAVLGIFIYLMKIFFKPFAIYGSGSFPYQTHTDRDMRPSSGSYGKQSKHSLAVEKSSVSVNNTSLFRWLSLHRFPPDRLYVSLYIQSQVQNMLNQFLWNSKTLQTSRNKDWRGEQLSATLFKATIRRIWKDTHCVSQCPAVRALLLLMQMCRCFTEGI